MRFIGNQIFLALTLFVFCVIHRDFVASYKSEIEITPSPPEETTTKKSGWFSGVKNFFRGSTTTAIPEVEVTTTKTFAVPQAPKQNGPTPLTSTSDGQKPPPLVLPHAPLMPLGPRPDTPPSSPFGGSPQQPPQWPQASGPTTSTTSQRPPYQQNFPQKPQSGSLAPFGGNQQPVGNLAPIGNNQQPAGGLASFGGNQHPAGQPNLPPGFQPYRPQRPQPSGLDLSYGGATGGRAPVGDQHEAALAPLTSSTTTTTTTQRPAYGPPSPTFDLRSGMATPSVAPQSIITTPRSPHIKEDFPPLNPPRRPSPSGTKEDFPALPTVRTPGSSLPATGSPTPASPNRPPSPSAWGGSTPSWGTPTPASASSPSKPVLPTSTATPTSSDLSGGNRVSFFPRAPGSSTTLRPGSQSNGNSIATDDEIRALTETLYTKEVNSQLNLIRVNPQGKTRSIDSADVAPEPLLDVDAKALEAPTIAKMRVLFNNYEQDTTTNEHVTPNERLEENDFLDAVMTTSVMRQAMLFLQNKGIVSPDPKTHRDLVKELWFTQYSRGSGKIGSSGFEHVFVNEVKNGTIIGLHNWVYFYEEEKAGHLDYKGYLSQLDLGTKAKVLKVRFTHNGLNKPVNTVFIGTSPELELALYTVCFQLRPDRTCPVSLANNKFGIITYAWRYRGKNLIGSAYPEI